MQTSTCNLDSLDSLEAAAEAVDGGEEETTMTLHRHIHHARRGRAILRAAAVKGGGRASGLAPPEELLPDTLLAEWERTIRIPIHTLNAVEAVGLAEATQLPVLRDTIQQDGRIQIRAPPRHGMRVQDLVRLLGDEPCPSSAIH
jgi:hypothetical protein